MPTFLQQVASHYATTANLSETVFILPNHRSIQYLRSAGASLLSQGSGRNPLLSARIISINDFLMKIIGMRTTERIPLLLTLYACYKELNPNAESLDDFIHWGSVMISDFDNIDKYLADPKKVFVNVSDFRALQDTFEYLTDTQRKAIEHFVSHFRDAQGRLTVNMDEEAAGEMKARFLKVWNLLSPLYDSFNAALAEKGMAYEGRIHRAFATALKNGTDVKQLLGRSYPGRKKFVFVGLNALNECEKTVLRSIRDASMAEFVWDFSSQELRDPLNRASFFLRKNVEEFPQAFHLDVNGLPRPEIKVVSVPSSVGQTKLAPSILSQVEGAPEDTVFVLPDESLLMPLLPGRYDTVNVTMGYPMDKSGIYSLMKSVGALQLTSRVVEGTLYFHHKAVGNILSSSLLRNAVASDEETAAEGLAVIDKVKAEAKQFVPQEDLQGSPVLEAIFASYADGQQPVEELSEANAQLAAYLNRVLEQVGRGLGSSDTEQVEKDFATRYGEILGTMVGYHVPVGMKVWLRLLDRLLCSETIPFIGDALKGLQVMGTLETRALDFKNVVILSANEDLFPHKSVDNSFIPPEIRKGFGLATVEYQDAVWAYYFYRLLQRAEKVWLVYDSRTEGLLSGEESRYIKQLQYHFAFPIQRLTAVAPILPLTEEDSIPKTEEDIRTLRSERHLSASSLQSYLMCQAKFYYQAVKGLKTEDDVTESLDAAMIGTIFHAVMQDLYKDKAIVTVNDIRQMLSSEASIREMIRQQILEKMRSIEVEGRNLIIEEVILLYVKGTLQHDLDLLSSSGSDGFRILGLEKYMSTEIDGFRFIGFIDRLDSYKDGEVRVVDYKTGHVEDEDINITDNNAQAVVDKLFGPVNSGRPKIALQLYLYGQFARKGRLVGDNEVVVNSIYSTGKNLTTPLRDVCESPEFGRLMKDRLHGLLTEIADTSLPFKRTQDKHVCEMCDFRSICGR